ncbi:MAG TPA: DUF2165 domain-containing protein [Acidobacteriaceae bacterium]|nr:DUF2165 domain-containing protein [Acidobacteriaceae bacterium]
MIARAAKLVLLAGVVLFYALVVFGNLTDPGSNLQFVQHVLAMDTTFPGNHLMWRALRSPGMEEAFFASIVAWEAVTLGLLAWGLVRLARAVRGTAAEFNAAKGMAIGALTASLAMWLVAFLDVGGEWFAMWQSRVWNGQEAAFRMFAVVGIVLLVVMQPDTESV